MIFFVNKLQQLEMVKKISGNKNQNFLILQN